MITQTNYSKAAMAELTRGLPRGTRKKVGKETKKPLTTIDNVWQGKQYDLEIIKAIMKHKRKLILEIVKSNGLS